MLYFLVALAMWFPASASLRGGTKDRKERLLGGLLVSVVWPVAGPALVIARLASRKRARV
jgi:hypothetical protein